MKPKISKKYKKAVKAITLTTIIVLALLCSCSISAQHHPGDEVLSNSQLEFTVVDEAVSVANYTDDTQEPEGWQLFPALFWDSNDNGTFEDTESIGYALSPSVHFSVNGEAHHFWPLHQSVLQDPGDAALISSGWVSEPNIYAAKVEDAEGLITLESEYSIFPGNSYFEHEITVTSNTTATLTNVSLIVYLGIDINGFFNDYAFIDAENNNMFKAKDNETGVWFGAYPGIAADNFEIGEWNDGPLEGEDTWQHCLNGSLDGTSAMSGDVEGALEFYLGDIEPGGSRSLAINYSLEKEENLPPVASLTYSPESPVVNETIVFNASSSYDPDGIITNYEWDFGDGNSTNTTKRNNKSFLFLSR